MKKLILVLVLISLLMLLGCKSQQNVVDGYKNVSIANMRVEIPNHWQRTEDYREQVEIIQNEWGGLNSQYFPVYVYQAPKGDVCLYLGVWAASMEFKDEGDEWEGWEDLGFDYTYYERFCSTVGGLFINETIIMGKDDGEMIQERAFHHTIHGSEAVEIEFTFIIGSKTCIAHVVTIYSENDLGVIFMGGEESIYSKYEEIWHEIMNSVKIT